MSDLPEKISIVEDATISLDPAQLAFFKAQIGLEEEELKAHITAIRVKAYEVVPYPCIKNFNFTKLRISRLRAFQCALQLAKERKDSILLDVGCCFGVELRKAVADGWPVENVVGFDIIKAFWDFGHELFLSGPESFPAAFVEGDIFDSATISPRAPFKATEVLPPRPDLKSLISLTLLQGHISAIYAASFFHLFDESKQLQIARRLGSLLSPMPGSSIFGGHVGSPVKEIRTYKNSDFQMFCHSPESWRDLWENQVFEKGDVRVDSRLIALSYKTDEQAEAVDAYWLSWSITRL